MYLKSAMGAPLTTPVTTPPVEKRGSVRALLTVTVRSLVVAAWAGSAGRATSIATGMAMAVAAVTIRCQSGRFGGLLTLRRFARIFPLRDVFAVAEVAHSLRICFTFPASPDAR